MKLFGFELRRAEEQRDNIEDPTVPVSSLSFASFFGAGTIDVGPITPERAMKCAPFFAGVAFLSRTLAALPLHGWRGTNEGPQKIGGALQTILRDAPNSEWSSFDLRRYFWQQLFTRGRGLIWIERGPSGQPMALWPMNVARTTVAMEGVKRVYSLNGVRYSSSEVIDVAFMLRDDQTGVQSPVGNCAGAIKLALEMEAYASKFFAGGGIPPLSLEGPLPSDKAGMQRAMGDIFRAIEVAKDSDKPIFPMPPGHSLKAVGIDPEKGQMTDARRWQLEEIARALQLPPIFLQDLTKGTLANTEQQDIFVVKHLISQWCIALEQQANLKLFGAGNSRRYVEHNVDGIQRGSFKDRIEGIARGIQTGQITPNEARELEGRQPLPNGDVLYVQGATVPLGSQPLKPEIGGPNDGQDGKPDAHGAA